MSAYDAFKVDVDLETKGVVLDYGTFRVIVARAGGNNKKYDKVLENRSRPYNRAIQTDTMDNTKAEDILKQAYAECVILDWQVLVKKKWVSGIEDPTTGKTVDFNTANVLSVLRDPLLKDLWLDIRTQARNAALFRASIDEARAGN